jgi:signal peptidase
MSKQKKNINDIKKFDNKKEYRLNKKSNAKKSNKKHIIKIIQYIIVFMMIIACGLFIYKNAGNPEKTPSVFGRKAFIIVSGSMIPEINVGDVVITNSNENIEVGKIIAYKRDSTIIVHRVVGMIKVNDGIMYQTKGDKNNVEDKELVSKDQVEGIVVMKIPYIGRVLMWLYNHLAWIIVMLITLIILNIVIRR